MSGELYVYRGVIAWFRPSAEWLIWTGTLECGHKIERDLAPARNLPQLSVEENCEECVQIARAAVDPVRMVEP